jgi:hypothetical protein
VNWFTHGNFYFWTISFPPLYLQSAGVGRQPLSQDLARSCSPAFSAGAALVIFASVSASMDRNATASGTGCRTRDAINLFGYAPVPSRGQRVAS